MRCRVRYLFIAIIAVSGIGQMILACGQKGPLYLPEPERKPARQTTAGTETDAARHAEPGRE